MELGILQKHMKRRGQTNTIFKIYALDLYYIPDIAFYEAYTKIWQTKENLHNLKKTAIFGATDGPFELHI